MLKYQTKSLKKEVFILTYGCRGTGVHDGRMEERQKAASMEAGVEAEISHLEPQTQS